MREIEASEIQFIAGGGKGLAGKIIGGISALGEALDLIKEAVANGTMGPANDSNTNPMGDTH